MSGDDPDSYALTMLGNILSSGRTGRLNQDIVEKRLALNAQARMSASRGPGLFTFSATVPPGGNTQEIEQAFDAEIARIQTSGVTDAEIQRARTQARAQAIVGGGGGGGRGGGPGGGMQSVLGRANQLSQNAIFYNDPGRINTMLPQPGSRDSGGYPARGEEIPEQRQSRGGHRRSGIGARPAVLRCICGQRKGRKLV